VHTEAPGEPVFLYGHSLGGLIALDYAEQHSDGLAGVVASAPVLAWTLSPLVVSLCGLLSRIRPTLSLERPSPTQDPLQHGRASVRLIAEEAAAMKRTNTAAASIHLPLLIVHGLADKQVPVDASRAFLAHVGCPDRTLREYADVGHFPHCEPRGAALLEDVADWLDGHIVGRRPGPTHSAIIPAPCPAVAQRSDGASVKNGRSSRP
jgi:acylglycerol lipase